MTKKLTVLQMGNDINIPSNGMITVLKMICNSKILNEQFKIKMVYFSFPTMSKKFKFFETIKAVIKFHKELPLVDIVHIHHSTGFNFYLTSYFAIVSKIINKKIIIHNHGAEFGIFFKNSKYLIKILIKKIFESADAAIILSESWFDWHFTNISKKAKWIVLRNPSPLPQPLYKIKNNGKRISILYMSRLEKRKGVYDLIDILPEVIKKNNDSFFCFAGDGDFEKVRDLIHEKNLSNNAKAIGWIDDEKKVSLLRDTDIFVLPSYNEGLPMALLEAMTFGIPCIATNVGGIPELIQNKKNGLLFFPGDKKKLKLNLSILIQNSEIRNSIGKAAYQTIKKSYTLSSYVKKLTNLYFNL